jgi:hypothetical protein
VDQLELLDRTTGQYREMDVVRTVRAPNINTEATEFIFLDNSGI